MKTLVVVATFPTASEAQMAQQCLLAAGIASYVRDMGVLSLDVLLAPAVGWVKVEVSPEDLAEARQVLEEPAEVEGFPPGRVTQGPAETAAAGDAEARRAMLVAVIASAVLPAIGHFWSLILLLSARRLPLTSTGRRHRRIAWVLDATVLLATAIVLGGVFC